MRPCKLSLPSRSRKPREAGLTMAIDSGAPVEYFADVIRSSGEHVDFVKFGWGTSIVSSRLQEKIDVLRSEGIDFYFGGTLFEKFVMQRSFEGFREWCRDFGCLYVEVSNGTIDLTDERKSEYVAELSRDFRVISEVGSKDQSTSEIMSPRKWIRAISDDLEAGSILVTLESRESGRGGICRPNGELRFGLIEDILTSGINVDSLLFEAPSLEVQGILVRRIGAEVNLGNVALTDLVGVETIRLGLRSETLMAFEVEPLTSASEGL